MRAKEPEWIKLQVSKMSMPDYKLRFTCECGRWSHLYKGEMNVSDPSKFLLWEHGCMRCHEPYYSQEEKDIFVVLGWEPPEDPDAHRDQKV